MIVGLFLSSDGNDTETHLIGTVKGRTASVPHVKLQPDSLTEIIMLYFAILMLICRSVLYFHYSGQDVVCVSVHSRAESRLD